MNWRRLLLFVPCISILLLVPGCRSKTQTLLPVTGAQDAMPALVTLARDNVLEYLLSSSRLADLPKNTDWQLDTGRGSENQFHFCSDNWRMVIWPPDSKDGVQRVILINKPKQAYWSGYVTSDGRVVDTAYYR